MQVYYSPAFLRQSISNALAGLRVLAEVYRAARTLYPVSESAECSGSTVVVHIDQLKAAGSADRVCNTASQNGHIWYLVRTSACEAVVQSVPLFDDGVFSLPNDTHQVLRIGIRLLHVSHSSNYLYDKVRPING